MIGLLLLAAGVVCIAGSWFVHIRAKKKAEQSQSWPSSQGTVTGAQVEHRREARTGNNNLPNDAYYVHLAYAYAVGGTEYVGKKIAFGFNNRFPSRHLAEKRLESWPIGSVVQVFYNPNDHAEAVLETKAPGVAMPVIFSIVGVVFVVVGGFLSQAM